MNYGTFFSTELQKRASYVPAVTSLIGAGLGGLLFKGKTPIDRWWSIGSGASFGMIPGMIYDAASKPTIASNDKDLAALEDMQRRIKSMQREIQG